MENTTKILNIEDTRSKDFDKASGFSASNIEVAGILNKLSNEFPGLGQQQLIKIIDRYNEIIIELLASGQKVNTGLFTLTTTINDPKILAQSIHNSNIEIAKKTIEKDKSNKTISSTTQKTKSTRSESTIRLKEKNLIINDEIPACGIAFRQWLCKA